VPESTRVSTKLKQPACASGGSYSALQHSRQPMAIIPHCCGRQEIAYWNYIAKVGLGKVRLAVVNICVSGGKGGSETWVGKVARCSPRWAS
jgi:hypothetical protein